ncbi:MAG TPA: hypothetical protein VMV83_07685 [Rectinemataceae bacterium]|nr:hypothetical protein [Rectinemataceae bacterium]
MAESRLPEKAAYTIALLMALLAGAQVSAADMAWQQYENGRQAFDARRFDVALTDWQNAIALRKERFALASADIEAALRLPEATDSWDRIDLIVERLATKEFGEREFGVIRDSAAGSLRKEMESLHIRTKSPDLANFTRAWLAVEELRGSAAIHNSLKALQSLAVELQAYPEAEFGIGRVFFIEGELALAELQYRKTLDEAASLEVPDDRLGVILALAAVHKAKGDWKDYEDDLRLALSDSVIFSSSDDFLRTAMERALDLQGFDVMLRLYPVDEPKIIDAASALGEFLLRNGRSQATISLALAADAILTRALAALREYDPALRYTTLEAFSSLIAERKDLASWCDEKGLWKYLYYLGESLLADSRLESGRQLLQGLVASKRSGVWGRAAAQALARPVGKRPAILP